MLNRGAESKSSYRLVIRSLTSLAECSLIARIFFMLGCMEGMSVKDNGNH